MKKSLSLWAIVGFTVTASLGSILHFLYEWTNACAIVAPFSAINESTWEHIKILFFPMFLFAIVESFYLAKGYPEFWPVKLKSIFLGLLLIPVLFYTYNGVFGHSPDFVNILIFILADLASYLYEYNSLKVHKKQKLSPTTSFILIAIISIMFMVFTFVTPNLPIFAAPSELTIYFDTIVNKLCVVLASR